MIFICKIFTKNGALVFMTVWTSVVWIHFLWFQIWNVVVSMTCSEWTVMVMGYLILKLTTGWLHNCRPHFFIANFVLIIFHFDFYLVFTIFIPLMNNVNIPHDTRPEANVLKTFIWHSQRHVKVLFVLNLGRWAPGITAEIQ